MTNLSLKLRNKLHEEFEIRAVGISASQQSSDGTIKYAFKLHDGNVVEGVLIPTPDQGYGMYFFTSRMQSELYFLCNWISREDKKFAF